MSKEELSARLSKIKELNNRPHQVKLTPMDMNGKKILGILVVCIFTEEDDVKKLSGRIGAKIIAIVKRQAKEDIPEYDGIEIHVVQGMYKRTIVLSKKI